MIALGVAGLVVSVEPASPTLRLELLGAARRFETEARPADLRMRADRRRLGEEPPGTLLFDSGGTWKLYDDGGRSVYRFHDPLAGPGPFKEARLAPDAGEGEIWLDPVLLRTDEPLDPLEFPLDELLFLELIASRGGVELHACAVRDDRTGKGYLFCGQSQDGKTTTARLWEREPGTVVLSDDRIVVRRDPDGTFWMWGTPWHGDAELAVSERAPVSAIFFLEHGPRNELIPTRPVDAVTKLVARSFPPFHSTRKFEATLEFLDAVVAAVPCRRFAFVPDADAVAFIRENAG